MAVKASQTITLDKSPDVQSITVYYKQVTSGSSAPAKPTTDNPSGWYTAEPTLDTSKDLYSTLKTKYTDGTFFYSDPQKFASYEAAKNAYNLADSKANPPRYDTFTSTTTTPPTIQPPNPPYKVDDIWYVTINTGSTPNVKTEHRTYKCNTTNPAESGSGNMSHWSEIASSANYTEFQQKADSIGLTASSAASIASIVAKINADGTSNAIINADHLNFTGKTFNLTTEQIALASTNFSVTSEGVLTCKESFQENTHISGGSIYLIDDGSINSGTIKIQSATVIATPSENDEFFLYGIKYNGIDGFVQNIPASPRSSGASVHGRKMWQFNYNEYNEQDPTVITKTIAYRCFNWELHGDNNGSPWYSEYVTVVAEDITGLPNYANGIYLWDSGVIWKREYWGENDPNTGDPITTVTSNYIVVPIRANVIVSNKNGGSSYQTCVNAFSFTAEPLTDSASYSSAGVSLDYDRTTSEDHSVLVSNGLVLENISKTNPYENEYTHAAKYHIDSCNFYDYGNGLSQARVLATMGRGYDSDLDDYAGYLIIKGLAEITNLKITGQALSDIVINSSYGLNGKYHMTINDGVPPQTPTGGMLVISPGTGNQYLFSTNNAQLLRQQGTTSQTGYEMLKLGNQYNGTGTSGTYTNGNTRGVVRLFQPGTHWTNLWANAGSTDYQTYLPAHNGTLVNATRLDSITSATSGNFTLKESYLNFDVIEVFFVYDDSSGAWQSSRMLVGGSGSRAIELVGTTDNGTNLYHAVAKYTFNGTSVTKTYEHRWMIRTGGYPTRTANTSTIKIWRVIGYKYS